MEWQPVPGPQTGEPVIAPAPEGISRIRNMLNRRRRKVRRGSNLCLSLPRRNTPRRQRPQQNMTLLRRRNTAAMAAGADPSADAGLSAGADSG
ncbi:hypothetical protein JS565_02025 [Salmonella enterica subsp. enterica serovar Senftenberg]|nr:hypothetical protein [Salmonella enterica subsp. enterica serovar Senftenberg]